MAGRGWRSQLAWSKPMSIQAINKEKRTSIPNFPGCYAFTDDVGPLTPGKVLYIGEASVSLKQRLSSYLVHDIGPREPIVKSATIAPPRTQHKGKLFVFYLRDEFEDGGVFLRWVEYGGWTRELEATLIDFYNPMYNSRDESLYTPPLSANETFDPRLLTAKPS